MAKDPAFLFYSNDFLSGTYLMTDEQVGKYIRLLCIQHQKGLLSRKDMLNICKTYDEDIFSKFSTDNDGNYFNTRLKEEYDKRKAYSESRRNNRKSKDNSKTSKTYVKHMEDEIENKDINKSKKEIIIPFDSEKFKNAWSLWKEYKKKEFNFKYKSEISEQASLNKLVNLANGQEDLCYEIIKQSIANSYKGFFEIKLSKANNSQMQDYKQEILNTINNAGEEK